jgi:hypothetical protein
MPENALPDGISGGFCAEIICVSAAFEVCSGGKCRAKIKNKELF